MNEDLKPGDLGISFGVARKLRTADAQAAFTLAEVIALRYRDSDQSLGSSIAADAIATQIRDLAQLWAQADKLKE